jgi:DNA-binding transcriptional LysR family regulator
MTIKHHQLAHALALRDHGKFHKAAKAQNLSQPAFSRSIRNLEQLLGVQLFERHADGVTPTVFGEAALRRAETIIVEARELEREIQLLRTLELGSFAVALALYPAELSGGRALAELVRQHPNLRCRASLGDWRNVTDLIVKRSVDLGLAEISVAVEDPRLETEVVGQHDLVLYCRSGHPLLDRQKVTNEDLASYPLALIRLPARMAGLFPGKGNFEERTGYFIPSIEVQDLATARAVVLGSDAFSAATPTQIAPWLQSGQFGVLPYRAHWLTLNYGFIYLRDRMLSPAAEEFMRLVREIEAEIAPRNRDLTAHIFSESAGADAYGAPASGAS